MQFAKVCVHLDVFMLPLTSALQKSFLEVSFNRERESSERKYFCSSAFPYYSVWRQKPAEQF